MKFYWNAAALIHVCIACDCCLATIAELNSKCQALDILSAAKSKIFAIWFLTGKSLPTTVPETRT